MQSMKKFQLGGGGGGGGGNYVSSIIGRNVLKKIAATFHFIIVRSHLSIVSYYCITILHTARTIAEIEIINHILNSQKHSTSCSCWVWVIYCEYIGQNWCFLMELHYQCSPLICVRLLFNLKDDEKLTYMICSNYLFMPEFVTFYF